MHHRVYNTAGLTHKHTISKLNNNAPRQNHCRLQNHQFTLTDFDHSASARHQSQDICPPISQIALKNFITISLIIEECPEEIFIKTGNCPEDFKV